MTEFLADNNICGQSLLTIVSVGNAIIAEILRLKDYIPEIFKLELKTDQVKYRDIILDFSYFNVSEVQENKIENNAELLNLDKEFQENHMEILTRFYSVFESIHQYGTDLKNFVFELNEGHYIQQSVESVLEDEEGKQLLCEALYLFGVMLLVVDMHIDGAVRERLIVSYYRYSSVKSHGDSNIDDICTLLRSTDYSNSNKKVSNYPENYFSRFEFDETFLDMTITRLRSDDIYNQISVYPHPDHRSTGFSNQAGMLFICLFFRPKILHNQLSQMREITDKFFSDNWVVSIYMGITMNLIDAWDQFKAARLAINSVVENTVLKALCEKQKSNLNTLLPKTYQLLKDGVLREEYLIKNRVRIVNLLRDCNVILRWFILHLSPAVFEFGQVKKQKQVLEQIKTETGIHRTEIYELLLNTSQLELTIKELLKDLLNEKTARWENYKKESLERLIEVKEAFSGTRPLLKIEKNENLYTWFGGITKEVEKLSESNPNISGRIIIQLIQALEEVQEFHNLDANMHIKQYLQEVGNFLHNMIEMLNIKEGILIQIQIISDFSYAWNLIDSQYTNIMQKSIKKTSTSIIKLRATFLKLASALEFPLLRINQAHSEDLVSVSQYYSSELANYIRKVVQIIPETMFGILAEIIRLQTEVIKEFPSMLEKDKLRDYVQFDERYKVAQLTFSISAFSEGVLLMKKTLVGVIELDPKQLLEDGIRKELVYNLSKTMHDCLIFSSKGGSGELEDRLNNLCVKIDGYKRSFEYIQDYLNINGLKILQEELSRIINYNVERECNQYQRHKIQDWQSSFQSVTIPIPSYSTRNVNDPNSSSNFIGQLAKELIRCTDPRTTIYLDLKGTWYERRTNKEIVDSQIFVKIRETLGPVGLVGLDKLIVFMFITDLKENIEKTHKNITTDKLWVEMLGTLAQNLEKFYIIPQPSKYFNNFTYRWKNVWPKLLDWILDLGHKQILRQNLAFELNRSCKLNAKTLESCLNTVNKAILNELYAFQEAPQDRKKIDIQFLYNLKFYLEYAGIYNPLEEIFISTKNSSYISLFFFLFTISHVHRLRFVKSINNLLPKKVSDPLEGHVLIIGILTVLQQFNKTITELYLDYLCQYARSLLDVNISSKQEIGADAEIVLHYLEAFVRAAKISRSFLESKIPEIILNQYEFLSEKN